LPVAAFKPSSGAEAVSLSDIPGSGSAYYSIIEVGTARYSGLDFRGINAARSSDEFSIDNLCGMSFPLEFP